jgi:hypothetical protein
MQLWPMQSKSAEKNLFQRQETNKNMKKPSTISFPSPLPTLAGRFGEPPFTKTCLTQGQDSTQRGAIHYE